MTFVNIKMIINRTELSHSYYFISILFLQLVNSFPPKPMSNTEHKTLKLLQLKDHRDLEVKNRIELPWNLSGPFSEYISHPKVNLPKDNVRQVLVLSLANMEPKKRIEKTAELLNFILTKDPIFEVKDDVMIRELKLLSMGILVQCQWSIKLPPPFDDKQCSITELDTIIKQICLDVIFEGLPICPLNFEQIPL